MSKKITTVSIDEDILRVAKKEIPNISTFVEDCLKSYLGFKNTNVKTIDEHMATIRDCLLAIELASKQDMEITADESFTTEQQQKAWIKLFGLWRNNTGITIDDWEEASRILKCTVQDLKGIFDYIEYNVDRKDLIKCNEWGYVKTLM